MEVEMERELIWAVAAFLPLVPGLLVLAVHFSGQAARAVCRNAALSVRVARCVRESKRPVGAGPVSQAA